MSDQAFRLAEDYHDFPSLADLCHSSPPIFPPASNKYAEKVQGYIHRYGEEFSDKMCQWYVDHGKLRSGPYTEWCPFSIPLTHSLAELRCLYAQGEIYGDFVDAFFAKNPHPGMSWVHEIEKERWGVASHTLLGQSERTFDLETRHVSFISLLLNVWI